ncbi:hypothetical protein N7E02_28540 [Aliirhizobium terrae]|nr:hypothetical protein [Rhizobium sp. CC-CFT758]WJH40431.1 hypothetical protein N7E02_28540 [Rhizobium sp. CC-CFT758]
MTAAWMGLSGLKAEIDRGTISLVGDPDIAARIDTWMVRSSFAGC